jgi:preprotein translocase subunit SecF
LVIKKPFSTIADANITTLIASIILFIFGTGPIKGFAVTLSIGVICSMFTAIIVTRILADITYEKNSNLRVKKTKYMRNININFNFMVWHKKAVYVSSFLIFVSLVSIFTRGLNYGVDFNGGTIIEISFENSAPIEKIRNHLQDNNYEKSSVQYFGSNKDILIRIPNIISASESSLSNTLISELNNEYNFSLKRVEYVGAQVGEELRDQGILAALIALALIMIYITLRFEYRFSIGAILALLHDVFLIIGIFSITQIEFNLKCIRSNSCCYWLFFK